MADAALVDPAGLEIPSSDEEEAKESESGRPPKSPKRSHPSRPHDLSLVPRSSDEPPAWLGSVMASMKSEVRSEISHFTASVTALGDLLERESSSRQKDIGEVRQDMASFKKRLDDFGTALESMAKAGSSTNGFGPSFNAVPPSRTTSAGSSGQHSADAWADYLANRGTGIPGPRQMPSSFPTSSPAAADKAGVNYDHVIMGGWARDTPRRDIMDATAASVASWNVEYRQAVTKTFVYGQRARTSHVILRPLAADQSKARFKSRQAQLSHGTCLASQRTRGDGIAQPDLRESRLKVPLGVRFQVKTSTGPGKLSGWGASAL